MWSVSSVLACLASEGCRGEAPAARASERRPEFLLTLLVAFLLCVSVEAAERGAEGIGREARVREGYEVVSGNRVCLLAEVGVSFSEGDHVIMKSSVKLLFL